METTGSFLLNPDERAAAAGFISHESSISPPALESVSNLSVFINSLLMAFASCLGAIPFFFVTGLSPKLIGIANSIACGVMLACSFDLIHEGEPHGSMYLILGLLSGTLVISWAQIHLRSYEDLKFESLQGANARKILLVLGIMAAHAAGEGAGVGVSYVGDRGWAQGVLVTCAIGLHNIPEGLAISTILISRGVPVQRAILWNAFVALPQALFAFPSFLFVETFKACLPFALGFAAGCMIWVVFSEILPDALNNIPSSQSATIVSFSAIWLESLRMFLEFLEKTPESHTSVILSLIALTSPVVTCMIIKAKVKCLSFSVGIGVGMQLVCGMSLFVKQLFNDPVSIPSMLLWSIIGSLVSILISKQIARKSQKFASGDHFDANSKLPTTMASNSKTNSTWILSRDLFFVLGGLSLMSLGAIGGGQISTLFESSKPWVHLMPPLLLQGSFYGIMIGLWALRMPLSQTWALIGVLGLAPLGGVWLEPVGSVKAILGGFILTSSLQLVCNKVPILLQAKSAHREERTLESVPEMSPALIVKFQSVIETDVWTNNPHFYQSIGVLIGAGMTIGYFTILLVLCKWIPLFCP